MCPNLLALPAGTCGSGIVNTSGFSVRMNSSNLELLLSLATSPPHPCVFAGQLIAPTGSLPWLNLTYVSATAVVALSSLDRHGNWLSPLPHTLMFLNLQSRCSASSLMHCLLDTNVPLSSSNVGSSEMVSDVT